MKRVFRNNQWRYVLLASLWLPILAAAELLLLYAIRDYALWVRILIIIFSALIQIGGCVLNVFTFIQDGKVSRKYLKPREAWRCISTQEDGQIKLSEHCQLFDLARDAYHLDAAWLDRESRKMSPGDLETRDRLLEQAVWLSVICDTPQLADVRFRLLCGAPINDGAYTDITAIMKQIMYNRETAGERVCQGSATAGTLADCLMFDAEGMNEADRANVCLALEKLLEDPLDLSEPQIKRFRQVLHYCGVETEEGGAA